MPAGVSLRTDFSSRDLRRLAAVTRNANQSRRLLSLAAVLDGMDRTDAARIGGMDRQTQAATFGNICVKNMMREHLDMTDQDATSSVEEAMAAQQALRAELGLGAERFRFRPSWA